MFTICEANPRAGDVRESALLAFEASARLRFTLAGVSWLHG